MTVVESLLGVCALTATVAVAVVLVAESGLLLGVALPAGSLVLGLGVLAGTGAVPVPVVAAVVAASTVLGAAIGHHRASRRAHADERAQAGALASPRLPAALRRGIDRLTGPLGTAVGRRPVRAAATAQFVVGARTVAPRMAGSAGVPLATMLRGTVPAAVVWSTALVSGGAFAGAALPVVQDAMAAVAIAAAVGVLAWVLHRRRSSCAASTAPRA